MSPHVIRKISREASNAALNKTGVKALGDLIQQIAVKVASSTNTSVSPKFTDEDLMAPGNSFKAIAKYIEDDNLSGFQEFLRNNKPNIEDKDENGNSLLMMASGLNRVDFCLFLLELNVDVNAENDHQMTAIHVASEVGSVEICRILVEAGSHVSNTDIGGWTPSIWACYRGHVAVVSFLISLAPGDINFFDQNQITPLAWSSGRGHVECVKILLENNANVDISDKYGTTALIWAARRGAAEIVDMLLRANANVDTSGMYSLTPLLVATQGNYIDVVDLILQRNPNVNTFDQDGMTALAIACKEGYYDIAIKLVSHGSYINIQDRAGDTCLIHASKNGHTMLVEALLAKYADVNVRGKENKTCLHVAIDKNHTDIVRLILNENPDLDIRTIDGDTALLRAVRNHNAEVVQMLLDKKVKINTTDARGDTALHIAMRTRSKKIVEVLLRNPRHSQLLYRPNKMGETPYNIDMDSQKAILDQIFGPRGLNYNENNENLLGYDLYSSALADILTEPSLSMPITVGLYAKWGSGKSFLLAKLKEEMKMFSRQSVDQHFQLSTFLFVAILHISSIIGTLCYVISHIYQPIRISFIIGGVGSVVSFVSMYLIVIIIWKGSFSYDWKLLKRLNKTLSIQFNTLKLIIQVAFCHPPGQLDKTTCTLPKALPLRLLFTDQTKIITSTSAQNSVNQIIGSLFDSIESQYGRIATRLFSVFKSKPFKETTRIQWKKICCIPHIVIYMMLSLCAQAFTILLTLKIKHYVNQTGQKAVNSNIQPTHPLSLSGNISSTYEKFSDKLSESQYQLLFVSLVILGSLVGLAIVANIYTVINCIHTLYFSHRKLLQRLMAKINPVKTEGYMQAIKSEVTLMLQMIKCLDAFTQQQSRLVVIVDGLDSCDQAKVLAVLDYVHNLFSNQGSPFIILLAIDPHVITKAIENNISKVFSDTCISGNAHLRNVVNLPFFLQNASLRKIKIAQLLASKMRSKLTSSNLWSERDEMNSKLRKLSGDSGVPFSKNSGSLSGRLHRSGSEQIGVQSNFIKPTGGIVNGPTDLTKMLVSDDYFSDVAPKNMRRLMNVIYVMGRLLKAFHIDFNWYHLASWVNITEQWPYRTSWIIFYCEQNGPVIENSRSLKFIFDRVRSIIPTQKELEPLLEMDRDEMKLYTFLSFHIKTLTLVDLQIFLPFTINLDPYIKTVIRDEVQSMEDMGMSLGSLFNGGLSTTQEDRPNTPNRLMESTVKSSPLITSTVVNSLKLTHRQSTELNKKMSDGNTMRPRTKNRLMMQQQMSVGGPYSQFTTNYPNPAPLMDEHKSEIPVFEPCLQLKNHQVSSLTGSDVGQVCALLRSMEGLQAERMDEYCGTIIAQNLCGTVLLHCDTDELKSVLRMNFGDWELFRLNLLALREKEITQKRTTSVLAKDDEQSISATTELVEGSISNRTMTQSNVERQVTLEDAMISGMLSTLNEEAQEDIMTEELLSHHQISLEDIATLGSDSQEAGTPIETNVIYLAHPSPLDQHFEELPQPSIESANSFRAGARSRLSSLSEIVIASPPNTSSESISKGHNCSPKIVKKFRNSRRFLCKVPRKTKTTNDYDRQISHTAPTTPRSHRKQVQDVEPASSSGEDCSNEGDVVIKSSINFARRKSRFGSSVNSLEKLNQVKKKIKHVLRDHPSDVCEVHMEKLDSQRHNTSGFFDRFRYSGGRKSKHNSNFFSETGNSITNPNSDSSCSSPEQDTVTKRPTDKKPPTLRDIFDNSNSMT